MRKEIVIRLLVVLCLMGGLAYGQSSKRASRRAADRSSDLSFFAAEDNIHVDLALVRPPIYSVDSRKTRLGTNVPDNMKYWLAAEISFMFTNRNRRMRPVLLEKMRVELYIFSDGPSRESSQPRWFGGVQTLHVLMFDPDQKSRRYWASLFLPPPYVYMNFPRDRSGKYHIDNLIGVVIITDQEANILGMRTFGGAKGKLTRDRARKLISAVSAMRSKNTTDMIPLWPREKTPWQWLDSDRFELPLTDLSTTTARGAAPKPLPPAGNEGIEE